MRDEAQAGQLAHGQHRGCIAAGAAAPSLDSTRRLMGASRAWPRLLPRRVGQRAPPPVPGPRSRSSRALARAPVPPGRVPPGPEAGEHAAGRQPRAAAQDLRLWVQQERARQPAQEHGRDARVHRARGVCVCGWGWGRARGGYAGGWRRQRHPGRGAATVGVVPRQQHIGLCRPAQAKRTGQRQQPCRLAAAARLPRRCCSARRTTGTRRTCGAAA